MNKRFFIYLLLLAVSPVFGTELILSQPKEILIPFKKGKVVYHAWRFPGVGTDKRITVEFEHRIDYPELGGWAPVWQINVNGTRMTVNTPDGQSRLLNKPCKIAHLDHKAFRCCGEKGNWRYSWYSIYSPDYESGKKRFDPETPEAYRLVLDITDLVKDKCSNRVELQLAGNFLFDYYKRNNIKRVPALAVRNFRVVKHDDASKITKKKVKTANFKVSGKTLLNAPEPVSLFNQDSKAWTFPAVKNGGKIVLEFEQRLNYPRLGGWNPCWQLRVNGKIIAAQVNRKINRLLNKPVKIRHRDYPPFKTCNGSKWYALFSPDFIQAASRFIPENPEAYREVLDITDLVNIAAENRVEIIFNGQSLKGYYRKLQIPYPPSLVIRNFKITHSPVPGLLKRKSSRPPYITMQSPPKADFKLGDTKQALTVRIGDLAIPIESRFSIPGKKELCAIGGQHELKTAFYTIKRRVKTQDGRIDVFDTITNTSSALIGLKIKHEIPSAMFDEVRLGGDISPERVLGVGGKNPTVFLAAFTPGIGIGLIAVDDVFRVQNIQYYGSGFSGIKTETFALSPGETRVMEWSIYPLRSPDYFDFINAVRRDWGVNFTIEGNFFFTLHRIKNWTPAKIKSFIADSGVKFNATPPLRWSWIDKKYKQYTSYLYGSALLDRFCRGRRAPGTPLVDDIPVDPMREYWRKIVTKFKASATGGAALCYIHTQLSNEVNDLKKYHDCVVTRANGSPLPYGHNDEYNIFIPKPDNEFGKKLMKTLEFIFDELHFDGIYHDELTSCASRITYNEWDKVSVELDENNRVKRKIGYVPLLKLPFNLQVMDYVIKQRNKFMVGNFSPETRTEMKYKFPRFEETFHNYMPLYSHLFSPIQLGDILAYQWTPKGMMEDIRNALKNGLLYYYYVNTSAIPTIAGKMFPFTPVELHKGWLLGKERILTIYSGEYGWRNEYALCVPFVYNETGKLTPDYPATFIPAENSVLCKLELKKNYCASLVKIPFAAKLPKDVIIRKLSYKNGILKCTLKGKGTVKISPAGKQEMSFQVDGEKDISI